jgi:hypothetical protein
MNLKLGRLPAKDAPALQLGNVLTGVIPTVPASEDYLARLDQWQMLGNDRYGDCVPVTWANTRRLVSSTLGTPEYPDLNQVLALYETQNPDFPNQDNGMVIQTALEHLHTVGGPDGVKAVAFAKVDHTNPAEVKAAIAIFGSVWTGITVTAANQTQFSQGKPWDYNPRSAVQGGHSVIVGGYGEPTGGDERFITWAQETEFTDAFWTNQVEEAWIVIWPEHLGQAGFLAGVDLAALAADYEALTGKAAPFAPAPGPNPAPTPPPAPNPTPTPTPDPENEIVALVEELEAWMEGLFESWHPHPRDTRLMRAAERFLAAVNRSEDE